MSYNPDFKNPSPHFLTNTINFSQTNLCLRPNLQAFENMEDYCEKEDLSVFIKSISRNVGRGIDENNGDSAGRENGRFSIAVFYNGKENAQKSYADCS